jgi:hypothetical protein
VRTILKHVIKHIGEHWPKVHIVVRGDNHYGRHEAMEWCEQQGVDYVLGYGSGNSVLDAMVRADADALCVKRAISGRKSYEASVSCVTAELEVPAPSRGAPGGDQEGS